MAGKRMGNRATRSRRAAGFEVRDPSAMPTAAESPERAGNSSWPSVNWKAALAAIGSGMAVVFSVVPADLQAATSWIHGQLTHRVVLRYHEGGQELWVKAGPTFADMLPPIGKHAAR